MQKTELKNRNVGGLALSPYPSVYEGAVKEYC